ncbi:MAG: class I SAM-dependent methyltransferase [Dehalococcoidales bacterium]|nr:MAG: class I SAM-dependent methyltransferase [Dehalococcoidales bacterium]
MKNNENSFENLINRAVEDTQSFKGWDFSHITDSRRMVDAPTKWNYINKVQPYLDGIDTLMDIGTAGGEILSRIHPLPGHTYAVEDYSPNITRAIETLEPLGIEVIGIEEGKEPPFGDLPFKDDYFDAIINRHTSYTGSEVYRILKPGGYYVTQQLGGLTTINLGMIIQGEKATKLSIWNLKVFKERMVEEGFKIIDEADEINFGRFFDVGAIVYHLITCPWTVEDFTPERYHSELLYLHNYIEKHGYFDMLYEWLFIVARKPLKQTDKGSGSF